jgi:hypothetical protein
MPPLRGWSLVVLNACLALRAWRGLWRCFGREELVERAAAGGDEELEQTAAIIARFFEVKAEDLA